MKRLFIISILLLIITGCSVVSVLESSEEYNIPTKTKTGYTGTPEEDEFLKDAVLFVESGLYEEGLYKLNVLLEAQPDYVEIMKELAKTYYYMQKPDSMIYYGMKGLQYDSPFEAELLSLTGSALINKGQSGNALKFLEKSYSLNPEDAVTSTRLGIIYINLGIENKDAEKLQLGRSYALSGIKSDPEITQNYFMAAYSLSAEDRDASAVFYYLRYLINPESEELAKQATESVNDILNGKIKTSAGIWDDLTGAFSSPDTAFVKVAKNYNDAFSLLPKYNHNNTYFKHKEMQLKLLFSSIPDKQFTGELAKNVLPYFSELYQNNYHILLPYLIFGQHDVKAAKSFLDKNKELLNKFISWHKSYVKKNN